MVANPEKFQLMFLSVPKDDYNNIYINIGNKKIYAVNDVKLLGVTIDNDLTFSKHIYKYNL